MRRWHTCFFILLFCGFSGNVLCKESINEAIERLYQPLTSNDDIPITDEFSLDLRSNMSATPGKMTPWLNNNLLCRCVDDTFVSAEIIQSTHLNGGRTHVLLQLVIKQNRTDIHRLLGLMLVRENDNHRWLIEDIDDGTEIPNSLRAEIREDTRMKRRAVINDPSSVHFSHSISMTALLAQPEKYHLQKVVVEGIGNIEFEGNALYLNKESWENFVQSDSVWLDIDFPNPVVTLARARQLNGDYVRIAGTFDMDIRGHLGMWSGGIIDITLYERVANRKEFARHREQEIKKLQAESTKNNMETMTE
ncbi:hypothetical protein ACIXPW_002266 [Escherichia coli]|uniref:hypothetical protein n=1 Tax=Escherichia coli TaxID=562 RepID=UPI000DA5DDDE|nr:hypothetical protein [Escherichia coli]EEZ5727228.1 hypothetical protein [Escherichia coli O25]EEV0136582.1 hypothetical protein [Escherichia coli]EEW4051620.1 hypothetical protein [Escherichia coli]EFB4746005.1 hypothetical protein [Escherichia coli]EFB5169303.1 hypothetical protein [Escherichia coli]